MLVENNDNDNDIDKIINIKILVNNKIKLNQLDIQYSCNVI